MGGEPSQEDSKKYGILNRITELLNGWRTEMYDEKPESLTNDGRMMYLKIITILTAKL